MRDIYLVRHGEAEAGGSGGDAARVLTERGKASIAEVGRALAGFGANVDAIWHSGFVRAEQTASILSKMLGGRELHVETALTPVGSSERAADAIRASSESLLCVSHMPLLPALVHELCGARVDFGTGTVAHVVVMGGTSALVGLWPADKLARVR